MLSSCCCLSLRTAAKIIAWINIVFSIILTIVFIIFLDQYQIQERHQFIGYYAFQYVGSLYLTASLFSLLIAVLLIWGIIKERHLLILPWLICSAASLTFSCFGNLFSFIVSLCQIPITGAWLPLVCLISWIPLAFGIYLHFVVYSLYKEIQYSSLQKCALVHRTDSMAMSTSGMSAISYVKV